MERISGFIIVCTAKFKFRVEKYAPAGVVISKKCLKVACSYCYKERLATKIVLPGSVSIMLCYVEPITYYEYM